MTSRGAAARAPAEHRESDLTPDDIFRLLEIAGAPPPPRRVLPDCDGRALLTAWVAMAVLCDVVNHLARLRPKSEEEIRRRDRPGDRSDHENIAIGGAKALESLRLVVREIETSKLDWLYHDLPKDPNDPWAEQRAGLISKYERAISTLTDAQKVLTELRDEAVGAPGEIKLDERRADPEILGRLHDLYVQITGDEALSHEGSAPAFILALIKHIGWDGKTLGAIRLDLYRHQKRKRQNPSEASGGHATLDLYISLLTHSYRSKR